MKPNGFLNDRFNMWNESAGKIKQAAREIMLCYLVWSLTRPNTVIFDFNSNQCTSIAADPIFGYCACIQSPAVEQQIVVRNATFTYRVKRSIYKVFDISSVAWLKVSVFGGATLICSHWLRGTSFSILSTIYINRYTWKQYFTRYKIDSTDGGVDKISRLLTGREIYVDLAGLAAIAGQGSVHVAYTLRVIVIVEIVG